MEKQKPKKDLILEQELNKDKIVVKQSLKIDLPKQEKEVALRIYESPGHVMFYGSTLIGGVKKVQTGFEIELHRDGDFLGKEYELTEKGTKIILQSGKIIEKKTTPVLSTNAEEKK